MTIQAEEYLKTILRPGYGTPTDSLFVPLERPSQTGFSIFVFDPANTAPPDIFNVVDPIGAMRTTIAQLEARVAALEQEMQMLRASAQEEVIVLRTVSREQAKEEIRALFATGATLFISEIAERLNVPDQLVVELCAELQNEGEIRVDERSYGVR